MPGILLEGESDTIKYRGVEHLLDIARQQYDSLQKLETSQQMLKFQPVTEEEFSVLQYFRKLVSSEPPEHDSARSQL
ncbi:hypothetical protein CNMCM5793_002337 [Aspergillus hiratsukae]|uniref:Uncharacterized protein n=1 Tax=Aspergillus hiratsukae TaxID=1194566 RepID=A0A8H6PCM3_9EURO|nr:hypothetical protein CNMCM5793_002337 [Aspergillus hiratsukae]KAF7169084.1 hypothetical protein CNMCM6106_004041 [Aspergillus hiratsukae]